MFWQIMILLVLLIPLLAIVLDSRVGEALAARLERGSPRADTERIAQRIRTLETEVERLTTEVQRLEEESDFLHKLLADRHPSDGEETTLPSGDDGG